MSQLINRYSEGVFIISATPFTTNGVSDHCSEDSFVNLHLRDGFDI
mgnify:CR=1 FL=1